MITGASGVGKTTLALRLSERLNLPVIPEIARQLCQSKGYGRIGEIPDQEGFKKEVLDLQIDTEEKLGCFVSDRCAIDCWVLWQRWNICNAMTYDSEAYYRRARAQAATYSHIIQIPPSFAPAEDSFRWTEPDYLKQIDRILQMTLFDFGLLDRTCRIETQSPAERIEEVLAWLQKTDC